MGSHFSVARDWMLQGKKVCRPSWEKHSYWYKGGAGIILYSDGTPAEIHLNQTDAFDWEVWKEEFKIERVQEGVDAFRKHHHEIPNRIKIHPNAIKQLAHEKINTLLGMKIIEDERICESEVLVYYETERALVDKVIDLKKRLSCAHYHCSSCKEYADNVIDDIFGSKIIKVNNENK